MVIIFWDVLMFDQIFLSPQMKRSVIISNKHHIYQLPHEMPNDLRAYSRPVRSLFSCQHITKKKKTLVWCWTILGFAIIMRYEYQHLYETYRCVLSNL